MSGSWFLLLVACFVVAGGLLLAVAPGSGVRVTFKLRFPRSLSLEQVVAFLSSLPPARRGQLVSAPPLVFEVVSTDQGVTHTLTVPSGEVEAVVAQLQAAMPGIRLEEAEAPQVEVSRAVMLRGRSRVFPLATARAEETATSILASMQPLVEGEVIRVQWLVSGSVVRPVAHRQVRGDWLDSDGVADSEQLRGLRVKRSELLVNACCRIGVRAGSFGRVEQLVARVRAGMSAMDAPSMEHDGPGYGRLGWLDVWTRRRRRCSVGRFS